MTIEQTKEINDAVLIPRYSNTKELCRVIAITKNNQYVVKNTDYNNLLIIEEDMSFIKIGTYKKQYFLGIIPYWKFNPYSCTT